jgi:hypothetical protein
VRWPPAWELVEAMNSAVGYVPDGKVVSEGQC